MRRALVEAGVLDEVFQALGCHVTAVVEIEVVQVGVVLVGLGAGVGRAACIVFPRSTLRGRRRRRTSISYNCEKHPGAPVPSLTCW